MRTVLSLAIVAVTSAFANNLHAQSDSSATKIVLVAGETVKVDKVGHHDYLGGANA